MRERRLLAQEITVLLINTCIGSGLITLPNILAKTAGSDGLWALCGTLIICAFAVVMFVTLIRKFPNDSMTKFIPKLLGKPLGFICNSLIALYFLHVTTVAIRSFGDIVNVVMLRRTPLEVVMGSMLLSCSILARNGIQPIARTCQIIAFLLLPFILIAPLLLPVFEFGEFLPLLHSSRESFLNAMMMSIFSISGFEIVLFLGPTLKEKNKLLPASLIGLFIVGLFTVTIVAMTFGTLTVNQVARLNYPIIEMIKYVPVPLLLLERIELIFFAIWISCAYSTIVILLNINAQHVSEMFNINRCKHFVLPIALLAFFLGRIPSNTLEVSKYVGYINIMWIVLVFGFIPLLHLIVKIKEPKSKNNKNKKQKKKLIAKSKQK